MRNGMRTNINTLMTNYLSISMMLIVGEIVFRYGIMAIFAVVGAIMLAYFASFIVSPMFKKYLNIAEKDRFIDIIRSLWNFEYQLLNLFSAIILFRIVLRLDDVLALFLIAVIVVALLVYKFYQDGHVNFVLISILATVLPIFVYIQKGVETVYHKLLYFQPRILHFDSNTLWIIFGVTFMIFFVKMFLPKQLMPKNHVRYFSKGLLAVFIVVAFIISFSTINIVTITENISFENVNELPILLIRKLSPTIFYSLIIGIMILSVTIVFVSFVQEATKRKANKRILPMIATIGLANVAITLTSYESFSMLFFFIISGLVISAFFILYVFLKIIKNDEQKIA